jgi:hypothetical protein
MGICIYPIIDLLSINAAINISNIPQIAHIISFLFHLISFIFFVIVLFLMDITNDLFANEQVINNIPYNSTNPALSVILNIEIILSNKGTDSVLKEKDQVPNVIAESNIKTIKTKYDSDKYCC